jgi:hypothetical protein
MGHVGPTSVKPDTYSPSEDDISRERTEALRWRSVFDNSAIGVAVASLNGRVIATNANSKEFHFSKSLMKITVRPTGRWLQSYWKGNATSFKSRSNTGAKTAVWCG